MLSLSSKQQPGVTYQQQPEERQWCHCHHKQQPAGQTMLSLSSKQQPGRQQCCCTYCHLQCRTDHVVTVIKENLDTDDITVIYTQQPVVDNNVTVISTQQSEVENNGVTVIIYNNLW